MEVFSIALVDTFLFFNQFSHSYDCLTYFDSVCLKPLFVLVLLHSILTLLEISFLFVGCNKFYNLSSGTIYSPLYPMQYPNNTMCTYNITVQKGEMIYLTSHVSSFIGGDTLELFERDSSTGRLVQKRSRYFGGYYTLSHNVLLKFKTDDIGTSTGFIYNYRSAKG